MLHFRLQVFRAAALHLNFTKAAEELYITQPAVTKHIKELENLLHINLFERTRSGLILTPAGQVLLRYAEDTAQREKELEYELGALRHSFSGHLTLGASTTIGQYVIPPVLAAFSRQYPDIRISLRNKNTLEIENDTIRQETDLGIIEGNSRKKELKYIPFMEDEIVAIAHTGSSLSRCESLSLEELKSIPLVLREPGSGSLDVITASLRQHDIHLKDLHVRMHLGSTESIKNLLRSADCLGFVSIHAISSEVVRGEFRIIEIANLDITRHFSFIYPQGSPKGLVERFMHFTTEFISTPQKK